jgi:hypothetical protein
MKRVSLFLLLAVGLLSSCTPGATTSAKPVEVEQFSGSVSYYPHEPGASWAYLAEGESESAPRLVYTVQGPTVVNEELWVVTSAVGKGLDLAWFRQYRSEGVFLLRELRPGMEVNYEPPMQEMPAEGSLRVGATWGGETTVDIYFPDAKRPEDQRLTRKFNYVYTVVDERKNINLPAGDFDAYVIDFVARTYDTDGNEVPCSGTGECKQTIYFTPNVGEVRTENGYFLVQTNVR